MKHLKILALAAMACAALMAFVGASSASATVLCGTNTSPCGSILGKGTVIEASSTNSGKLTGGGITLDTCTGSTLKGTTSNSGGATETVKGPIETLNWGTCTNTTTTITKGELEIHSSGAGNGTVTSVGTQVTVNTVFGSCVYSAKDIGTLVGGSPAKIEVKEQSVTLVSGPCPAETKWTQNFSVTSPGSLWVAES